MKTTSNSEAGCGCLLTVIVIAVVFAAMAGKAHLKSRSYNRLTGANTTWVDAMFTDLRVIGNPK